MDLDWVESDDGSFDMDDLLEQVYASESSSEDVDVSSLSSLEGINLDTCTTTTISSSEDETENWETHTMKIVSVANQLFASKNIPATVKPEAILQVLAYDLPLNFSKAELFRLFVPYGPIEQVEASWEDFPNDPNSSSTFRYGYVKFFSPIDATRAAKALNEKTVKGNKIHTWQLFNFSDTQQD